MNHPLHPALVHFPVACWSLATLADVASPWLGEPAWRFAGVAMAIGTVSGIAAMLAGMVEFMKLDDDAEAVRDANRHMLLAMAAWGCYATSMVMRLDGLVLAPPGALAIGMGLLGFLALVAAGWLGGRLVYVHRIGVRR